MLEGFLLQQNIFGLFFLAGMILQLLIIGKEDKQTFFSALIPAVIVSVFVFIFSMNLAETVFGLFYVFLLFSIILLREKLLVELNRVKLLLFSLAVCYFCFVFFGLSILLILPFLFLAVVLFYSFSKDKPDFKIKLLLFVFFVFSWFVLLCILMPSLLILFTQPESLKTMPLFEAFFFGASTLTIIANLFYLYILLPLPGKFRSFSQALKDSKQYAGDAVSKFDDSHAKRIVVVLILVLVGGFLLFNATSRIFDDLQIAILLILLSSASDYFKKVFFYSKKEVWQ